jgi:acyl carrier protein phosphodiesterase
MNFLAHLVLAGDDEGLRLGAMLGDFVRGRLALAEYEEDVQLGILLHRHIDATTDSTEGFNRLRSWFPAPFRRYAGIIIDLAFDHELARRWDDHFDSSLADFDRGVREMLTRNEALLPRGLRRFMTYADRRGLFETYRDRDEVLYSLAGVGTRLSRKNPLHRVEEIWDELEPKVGVIFEPVFGEVQSGVADWLKAKSTMTGS